MSRSELEAIANYGFCIQPGECITQDQALQIAVGTTASKYGLEDNWEQTRKSTIRFFTPKIGATRIALSFGRWAIQNIQAALSI